VDKMMVAKRKDIAPYCHRAYAGPVKPTLAAARLAAQADRRRLPDVVRVMIGSAAIRHFRHVRRDAVAA